MPAVYKTKHTTGNEHSPEPDEPECHPRKSYRPGILRMRKLLDAAIALFVEQGIHATTIDDIVARAGIAKATFYHYFESKQALLQALREDLIEQCNSRVIEAVEACPKDDLHLRLVTWVKTTAEVRLCTVEFADIIFSQESCPLHWTVSGEAFMKDFVTLLQRGNRLGLWSVKKPALTATMLSHGMLGVLDDVMLRGADPRSVLPDIVEFAVGTISPR